MEGHLGEVTSLSGHKWPRKVFVPRGTLSGKVSWEPPEEGEVEPGGWAGGGHGEEGQESWRVCRGEGSAFGEVVRDCVWHVLLSSGFEAPGALLVYAYG